MYTKEKRLYTKSWGKPIEPTEKKSKKSRAYLGEIC
jgi:hypothetical protein